MLVNRWADHRPRAHRLNRQAQPVTIPSPFAAENRQFYASVDRDFDSGSVEVAPGIVAKTDARSSATVIAFTPRRRADVAADRDF